MRPNTPHVAIAVQNTIVFGGHFYSLSNLRDTLSAIVHSCILGGRITRYTGQEDPRYLLFSMLGYLYKFYAKGANRQSE